MTGVQTCALPISEIEREKVRLNVSNSVFEAEVGIKKRTNVKNRCKMRNGGL